MRRSLLLLTFPIYLGMVVAFLFYSGPDGRPLDVDFKKDKGLQTKVVRLPKVLFRDVTKEAGIEFTHNAGSYGEFLMPETIGPGCGFFDFDNDGDQDVLLVNSGRWAHRAMGVPGDLSGHALYRNDGSGNYADVTKEMGLLCNSYGQGVCFGDIDNDDFEDIYITCYGRNVLYRNVQGERFEDITEVAGVECPSWSVSAAFLDYDRDGKLDLFVGNYVFWSIDIQRKVGALPVLHAPSKDRSREGSVVSETEASSRQKEVNAGSQLYSTFMEQLEYPSPQEFDGDYCRLYRNVGGCRFRDVSERAGILRKDIRGRPSAKALGVGVCDYNEDGWPDIAVANDQVPNFLFRNLGDGTFEEVASRVGVATDVNGLARAGMGIHWADYRNDGSIGLAIGNFTQEMVSLFLSVDKERQIFTDVAVEEGIGEASQAPVKWGLFFLDYDLDGRLDLFIVNGHFQESVERTQAVGYAQQSQLFWNRGTGSGEGVFCLAGVSDIGSELLAKRVGRGAAYGDIDSDGDLDLLIATNRGPAFLFRNECQLENQYLRLKLRGTMSNRSAIGAKARVRVGKSWQRREVISGSSYASQGELILSFGLGSSKQAEEVEVKWPSGRVTRLNSVRGGRTLLISEDEGLSVPRKN